jgi:hypothetical protein
VPTHADIPELDVVFVDERDERVNPLGIKGLGEVAIVGLAFFSQDRIDSPKPSRKLTHD